MGRNPGLGIVRASSLSALVVAALGCGAALSSSSEPQYVVNRRYCHGHARFGAFFLGESLRGKRLRAAFRDCLSPSSGASGATAMITYVYGRCHSKGSAFDEMPCSPPVQMNSEPLGECHARSPHRRVHGVPARVGDQGRYIALYTGRTTIEIDATSKRLAWAAAAHLRIAPKAIIPDGGQGLRTFPPGATGARAKLRQPNPAEMRKPNDCA